jgi:SMI1/KNR4 family protein SUKH-1
MSVALPDDYREYLESDQAVAEGFTEGFPGYFMLWSREEIETANTELEVGSLAPGFLGFGTNGGGEMLAFDSNGAVYCLPMIGMEVRYAKKVASSWTEFRSRIKHETNG